MSLAIVWFRRDLRLNDNPALAIAATRYERILPVYIHAPDEEAPWQAGAASNWWLHRALADLDRQLDGRLSLRMGSSRETLFELIERTGADAVYWNRLYEPAAIARDSEIKQALRKRGTHVESANAALLFEPWEIQKNSGGPLRVFTPFWKKLLAQGLPSVSGELPSVSWRSGRGLDGICLEELGLLPAIPWDHGMAEAWVPTRSGAEARLDEFVASGLRRYADGRDRPDRDEVSRLSPYLHFGQLGPRELVSACQGVKADASAFLRELGWREFAHHLLFHFPQTTDVPLDNRFGDFPWRDDSAALAAWQRGETGIPLVDAGMRQLWATGWMHNRVRMVVASFLTKNLLLPWQFGARWFWDTLVDADLANNTLGWQWTAGCGADAAPYFRVFNPVTQGQKFDREGEYVRRWVPELAPLPAKWIHQPWTAPADVLATAGLKLDRDYPMPLVDLKTSRLRALEAWGSVK